MRILAATMIWFQLLGLSIWLGGMVVLGALVAPTVFTSVEPYESAGEVMTLLFRKFNGSLVYGCAVLVLVGFIGKWFLNPMPGWSRRVEGILLGVMIVSAIYIGSILGPRMQELRIVKNADPNNTLAAAEFQRGHTLSRALFTLNLGLGMPLLFIHARESLVRNAEQ